MRRHRPPFEHVEPPRIVGEMHADMVRHEIQDQPEVIALQRVAEPCKAAPRRRAPD